MRTFQLGFTGDFLDASGASAYDDISLTTLDRMPFIRRHFLMEHAPRRDDPSSWARLYSMEVTPEQIADLDGLVVLRPWVKRSTFAQGATNLVMIGRSGAGYDKIDLAACTENDVALFNAPLALNHSTAATALLFMLALAKNLRRQEQITRTGRWDLQAQVMGGELPGRTLGIVGLGHSGRELARLLAPFGMRLKAFSPHADPIQAAALGIQLTALEPLLREADFVSLHCRLTDQTRKIIGAAQFAWMKPSAYFINVARGELVDQAELVEALRAGTIAGAGLDVFEVEPLPADDPLLQLDNVIVTPHWSASTRDVWHATGQAMADGMIRTAQGLIPECVVNVEVLDRPGFQAKLQRFARNQDVDPKLPST